jgi:hypothetical protein
MPDRMSALLKSQSHFAAFILLDNSWEVGPQPANLHRRAVTGTFSITTATGVGDHFDVLLVRRKATC